MRLAVITLLLVGLSLPVAAGPFPFPFPFHCPASVVPAPPVPAPAPVPVPRLRPAQLKTSWGFRNENAYNKEILRAVSSQWQDPRHPLPPLLFKALIAVESSFRPAAVSPTGAVGLTQLTPATARHFGLSLRPDQRLDPMDALRAGVDALREKHRVLIDPSNYYTIVLGRPHKQAPWAARVAVAYDSLGRPHGDDLWRIELAAYNGGGQTLLRAMARAYDRGVDPCRWSNLVNPVSHPRRSPLYQACREIYHGGAACKYHEICNYPARIFALYREAGGR